MQTWRPLVVLLIYLVNRTKFIKQTLGRYIDLEMLVEQRTLEYDQ